MTCKIVCMADTGLRPQIRPIADLTPDNLRRVLEDMGAEPGWYTSAALYDWYASMAREGGLTPVSKKRFGAVLGELGYKRAVKSVDGKTARSWFITRRAIRGEAPRG